MNHDTLPFVTVIIPCYNEARWMDRVLHALEAQTYPRELLEILVVDNNSTDNTRKIVARHHERVKLLIEKERSSYKARNRGIQNARGDYLAFLDGDCIPDANWIASFVEDASKRGLNFLAGRIENRMVFDNLANRLLCMKRNAESRKQSVERDHCVPGGNMFISASLFKKHGCFSSVISGSDNEFSRRLHRAGVEIGYTDDALVTHQCDLTNGQYLKRAFRIRYGQARNRGKTNAVAKCSALPMDMAERRAQSPDQQPLDDSPGIVCRTSASGDPGCRPDLSVRRPASDVPDCRPDLCVRRASDLKSLLRSIPWKPGINRAKELNAALGGGSFLNFLFLLYFLWLERWFAYFGGVCGAMHSRLVPRL